jgi:hypothetical protein
MVAERRKYDLKNPITVNEISVIEVVIDAHIDKHSDHITDDLVLQLVESLNGKIYLPSSIRDEYSYYVSNIAFKNCIYRLVWLQEKGCLYIGVITAFKDKGVRS